MSNPFDLNTLDVRAQQIQDGTIQPNSTPTFILVTETISVASVIYSVVTGTSKRCL